MIHVLWTYVLLMCAYSALNPDTCQRTCGTDPHPKATQLGLQAAKELAQHCQRIVVLMNSSLWDVC